MNVVVDEFIQEFKFLSNKPFILFWRDLGTLIDFEPRRLQKDLLKLLEHLIISGYWAPRLPLRYKPIDNLTDAKLILKLVKYNGNREEILNDKVSLEMFLPIKNALKFSEHPIMFFKNIIYWIIWIEINVYHFLQPGLLTSL